MHAHAPQKSCYWGNLEILSTTDQHLVVSNLFVPTSHINLCLFFSLSHINICPLKNNIFLIHRKINIFTDQDWLSPFFHTFTRPGKGPLKFLNLLWEPRGLWWSETALAQWTMDKHDTTAWPTDDIFDFPGLLLLLPSLLLRHHLQWLLLLLDLLCGTNNSNTTVNGDSIAIISAEQTTSIMEWSPSYGTF